MPLTFSVDAAREAARAGRMYTPHRIVRTPVFMPVGTLATVKAVPQHLLEELGIEVLLSNTYHLLLRPGAEMVRRLGGLHRFMSWERAILTDSGGFQVFSLASRRKLTEEGAEFRSHLDGALHFLSPEKSIEVQIALGADIIMAFDECTEYPAERERARQSMELTLRWAKRCKEHFEAHKDEVPWHRVNGSTGHRVIETADGSRLSAVGGGRGAEECIDPSLAGNSGPLAQDDKPDSRSLDCARQTQPRSARDDSREDEGASGREPVAESREPTQSLFGIVQGGMYADLRAECARRLVELDFPGYAIGGLSVGEPREVTYEMVARTLEHLPADKPRYVMGVGTPEEIVQYAKLGVDMMDCVMPTRAARHGLLFTREGRINIKGARYAEDEGPVDAGCGCRVCTRYSRAYLRHLYATNEVLAQVLNTVHNLAYYLDTMRQVRQSIVFGEFTSAPTSVRSQEKEGH